MGTFALTPFGKEIKKRLVDTGHTQAWLIEQVAELTGLYFDRSYMYKIQTGQANTPKIVRAIREILDLPEQGRERKLRGGESRGTRANNNPPPNRAKGAATAGGGETGVHD